MPSDLLKEMRPTLFEMITVKNSNYYQIEADLLPN